MSTPSPTSTAASLPAGPAGLEVGQQAADQISQGCLSLQTGQGPCLVNVTKRTVW